MMKHLRLGKLFISLTFFIMLFSYNVHAQGQLTHLSSRLSFYSEYYPNPSSNFEGTIVFINGSATDLSEWKNNREFFNCVRQMGSVFLYDRNGLGKSPLDRQLSSNNTLDAKFVSDNLLMLLRQLNIKPPYLLVAHSYGAIYAGYITLKHPDLVNGLLLVDPVPKDFHFTSKHMAKFKKIIDEASVKSASEIHKKYGGQKTESIYQLLGFEKSKHLLKQLGNINDGVPVIILSSTEMGERHPIEENWYISQKQWLNHNALSKIIQVHSNHFIQLKKPQVVCHALKELVSR